MSHDLPSYNIKKTRKLEAILGLKAGGPGPATGRKTLCIRMNILKQSDVTWEWYSGLDLLNFMKN